MPDLSFLNGLFVRIASRSSWGIGRIQAINAETGALEVSYFLGPGKGYETITVPSEDLERGASLQKEQRVYRYTGIGEAWEAGRILEDGLHRAEQIRGSYPDAPSDGDVYLVRFPKRDNRALRSWEIEVTRECDRPDPLAILRTCSNDGPFHYWNRKILLFATVRQRAVYRGMTALASSSIEFLAHQISVVRRVLHDPIPRYILADEVGLGKTIEAGIIIRQHLLDSSPEASVVILVPAHLGEQWKAEMIDRFGLKSEIGQRLHIVSYPDLLQFASELDDPITMLVVDEAHRFGALAFSDDLGTTTAYHTLAEWAESASAVLLLSATPVLRNELTFLALLHLLDPLQFRLREADAFRHRVRNRQPIADLLRVLRANPHPVFIRQALRAAEGALRKDDTTSGLVTTLQSLLEGGAATEERELAVRRLRVHLQETHRLHRRLIRTRRASAHVKIHLPERRMEVHHYQDVPRKEMIEGIERWRIEALIQPLPDERSIHANRLLTQWISAALTHPHCVGPLISSRLNILARGEAPLFPDEEGFLREIEAVHSGDDSNWFLTILSIIFKGQEKRLKSVLFLSDPLIAAPLVTRLGPIARLLTQEDPSVIQEYQNNDGVQVLVVDRENEEGLNLQTIPAQIIHGDVPMSPVRIEQRIGRLDRLNAARNVLSHVLIHADQYSEAWGKCLQNDIGVFEGSVSSLQYVLNDAMDWTLAKLLENGAEAFDQLSEELSRTGSELNLKEELAKNDAQDLLDAWEEEVSEDIRFEEELNEYEFFGEDLEKDAVGFIDAFRAWAGASLRLDLNEGPDTTESRIRFRHKNALITKRQFFQHFATIIDPRLRYRTPAGDTVHFSRPVETIRKRAISGGTPVARLGHPAVDGIIRMLERDDRGIAFAFWRQEPLCEVEGEVEAFLLFNFCIEATVPGEDANLRRRADGFFTPQTRSIWLNQALEQPTPQALKHLSGAYDRSNRDVSVSSRDDWARVRSALTVDWESFCQGAYEVAFETLERDPETKTRLNLALSAVDEAKERADAILRNRRLAGALEHTSACDEVHMTRLSDSIRNRELRLDSVGAVFLSRKPLSQFSAGYMR